MKNRYLYLTILFSFLLSVLPFLLILKISNWSYPKIPVQITDDSIFYYTRAVDIYKGNPFIGNPYVLEYKDSVSANFFVADWLWSSPLFLGFSINQTILLNQIIWFVIFGFILYRIFYEFGLEDRESFYGVLLSLVSVYWYLARPVSMQIVYPFFLGFIFVFFLFLKNPDSWKRRVVLGLYSGIALYIYTYLAYIMAISYILLFIYFLFEFDKKKLLSVFVSGSISFILSIPFVYYTLLQTSEKYYVETVQRLGLLYTHSLSSASLIYFLVCLSLFFIAYFYKKYFSEEQYLFLQFISIALSFTSISNIVIGVDFELAQHIGRFVDLYICIFFIIVFIKIYDNNDLSWKLILPTLLILFIWGLGIKSQIGVWSKFNSNLIINESYYEPLDWIKNNTKPGSVILANDDVSGYIPLLTNSYVLFNNYVGFHIMSNKEVEDRYLVSRMYNSLDLSQIKNDFRKFAGVGNAVHQYKLNNRNSKICSIFKIFLIELNCKNIIGPYDIKGENYFKDLQLRYSLIKKKQSDELKYYNVSYVLVDKNKDDWSGLKNIKLIWSNERYLIYKI